MSKALGVQTKARWPYALINFYIIIDSCILYSLSSDPWTPGPDLT